MKPRFAAVALLAVSARVRGEPPDAQPISLTDAVDRALAKNQEIAVQRASLEIADASLARAKGSYDPGFQLNFLWSDHTDADNFIFSGAPPGALGPHSEGVRGEASLTQLLPTGGSLSLGTFVTRDTTDNIFTLLTPSYSTFVGLDLRQPLLQNRAIDPARLSIRVARLDRDRSIYQLQATVADTVAAVERAYWTLSEAQRDVEVRREAVRLAEEQQRDTQTRIDTGFLSKSDIAVPVAEVERRRGDLYAAQETARRAGLELKTLMLDDPADPLWDRILVPSDGPETDVEPVDLTDALANAPARRPEVSEAQARLSRQEVESESARNRVLPRLDLVASYARNGLAGTQNPNLAQFPGFPVTVPGGLIGGVGRSWGTIGDNDFPNASVGFSFGIPIGNHAAKADAAAAAAEQRQAAVTLAQIKQRVGVEVRSAALALETAAQRIEAARAGLRAAQTQLTAEKDRFAAGLTTNFFVLTRQNDLAQAQLTETAALVDYRKARTEFARAAGSLLSDRKIEFSDTAPDAGPAGGGK